MAFHGVFVGIDRYASPRIGWLSCCANDARALWALFRDTLGGDGRTLIDGQATKGAILAELEQLQHCAPEDLVVVCFSGHGSETHELATYDADLANLGQSALPLAELARQLELIPAKNVLCILDCCFAGGLGAKVLRSEARAKGLNSVDQALEQLSGEGRLVLAASGPTEEAWESSRHGHSVLTWHVLEALQGPAEVVVAGKIQPFRLLEFVSKRVADTSTQLGLAQHPAVRGSFDGEVSWPIFKPGTEYLRLFPTRGRTPATADIESLASFGFPPPVLAAWAGAIPSLNPLQLGAINDHGILGGANLVVSAPTSSGKTLVGELAALKGTLDRRRAAFLLPLKALVADKHLHFDRVYKPLDLRTIEATGDSDDISDLLRGQYDLALLTYEKFTNIVLAYPHVLDQIGTLVIDEVQMIADTSRGATLEFLLTLLRSRQASGRAPQLIALSAVIGDTNGLERWLGARLLRVSERPVPLDEGLLLRDGRYRHLDGSSGKELTTDPIIQPVWGEGKHRDWIIPLVKKLVVEGKQVIVFRETKAECFFCAKYLSENLGLPSANQTVAALPRGDEARIAQSLREVLVGGVAFHHSELTRDERRVVEEAFRAQSSEVRVIVATTTLAMGVNLPAQAVVIDGLQHPGPNGLETPYTVAEYKNLVGRAGRLGMSERGEAFLLAVQGLDEHQLWTRYVTGKPEDLHSRFLDAATDIRSLILRVCTFTQALYPHGIIAGAVAEFLESSFGAFQQKQQADGWRWDRASLEAQVESLASHRLLEKDGLGRLHLTEIGRIAGEGGLSIESVVRLVECLSGVNTAELSDPALIAACQWTEELDDILFPLNKRSTQKEPAHWAMLLRQQDIPAGITSSYRRQGRNAHDPTLRAKRAVSCLFYIAGVPMANIETEMLQFGGQFNAAGAIRSVADRTCDVLSTAARIAEVLHPGLDLAERSERLLVRLNAGVQGNVVDVARHVRGVFTRAEYKAIGDAGKGTAEEVVASTDRELLPLLGNSLEKVATLREAAATELVRRELPRVAPVPLPLYEA